MPQGGRGGGMISKICRVHVVNSNGDFSISLIDVVYFENMKQREGKPAFVRLTLGEDHEMVEKRILESPGVFSKHYAWHYEKECRLLITLSEKWKIQDSIIKLKLSKKTLRKLENRVIKSPLYQGVDFGKDSVLSGSVKWDI